MTYVKAKNKKRVGFVLDEKVVNAIDDFASRNGISRAGAVSVLCMQSLNQTNFMENMTDMIQLAKEAAAPSQA